MWRQTRNRWKFVFVSAFQLSFRWHLGFDGWSASARRVFQSFGLVPLPVRQDSHNPYYLGEQVKTGCPQDAEMLLPIWSQGSLPEDIYANLRIGNGSEHCCKLQMSPFLHVEFFNQMASKRCENGDWDEEISIKPRLQQRQDYALQRAAKRQHETAWGYFKDEISAATRFSPPKREGTQGFEPQLE